MNKSRPGIDWIWLAVIASSCCGLWPLLWPLSTLAQLIPDGTLGTTLQTSGAIDRVNGGFQAGINLFHSFLELNGATGRVLSFTDPGVSNILVRVTGGNPSTFNGQIAVNGAANLFVLNPNGIVFGPRATLNVRGSFVATTADAIGFGETGQFTALPTDLPAPLTVQPSAFLFNQLQKGSQIQSQGNLRLREGRSLLLIGGDVSLQGGQVVAPRGQIELGGLAQPGAIDLTIADASLSLTYPRDIERGNLRLSQRALVDTRGSGGGAIQLQGREIVLQDFSRVLAETTGAAVGKDVFVQADQLQLLDGSLISTTTRGPGTGGNLTVNVTGLTQLSGVSPTNAAGGFFSEVTSGGAGGGLTVNTGQLVVEGGAIVSTAV
ncbi:MAG: filamentous hemagglutinin N-terminal domain-containing protein, partial [Leptolyngbyaceae cyanobacterium bins.59]|nr:filamentous hemagglutinin N-terminal domain-containing protein [Leptolyngbyaceae cyanobacterium bins.59]